MDRIAADTRLGRYVLLDRLGAGGMAEVWRARDAQLDRDVAVKVVRSDLAADDDFRERFLREARLVATLDHPHVLPVWDCGETGDRPWIVMPLVPGGTLTRLLEDGPIEPARAAEMLAPLAEALDAAHAAGILHRDVKPANVLVAADGRLLLADFGIARLAEATTRLTRTGTVVGTPLYMAPEVAVGGAAGPESDRYSLGVLLYEMVAGRPPFEGENPLSILHQHATTPAPPLRARLVDRERATEVPDELDRVLERILRKEPGERHPSCRAFVAEVAAAVGEGAPTGGSRPVSTGGALDDPERTLELPRRVASGRTSLWPRRLAVAVALLAVVLLLAVARKNRADRRADAWTAQVEAGVETGGIRGEEENASVEDSGTSGLEAPDPEEPTPGDTSSPSTSSPSTGPAATAPEPASAAPVDSEAAPAPRRPAPARRGDASAASGDDGAPSDLADLFRTLERRPTRDDFEALAADARGRLGSSALAAPLLAWAEGGLAGVDGRAEEARARASEWMRSAELLGRQDPGLVALLRSRPDPGRWSGWELALAYLDPLATAGPELDAALAGGRGDARVHLGRALVARLDGDASRSAEASEEAWRLLPESETTLREATAVVRAHAAAGLDRPAEILEWLLKGVEVDGPSRGRIAWAAAPVAFRLGRRVEGRRLQGLACREGVEEACRERPLGGRPQVRPGPPRRDGAGG